MKTKILVTKTFNMQVLTDKEQIAVREKFHIPSSMIPVTNCTSYGPFTMHTDDMWEKYKEDIWAAERAHFARK